MPEKRKTILEDFLGTECSGCGGVKSSKHSHCNKCYYRLLIDGKDLPKGIDFKGQVPMTFGGIPLKVDSDMRDDVIEFYQGTELVGRIFNLAKPPGL